MRKNDERKKTNVSSHLASYAVKPATNGALKAVDVVSNKTPPIAICGKILDII